MPSKKPRETATKANPSAKLKHVRERSGKSLQYISEQTLIPLARLQALENGDFKAVGGSAYVIGYTRAVAQVIGADPAPLVNAFESALNVDVEPAVVEGEPALVPSFVFPNIPKTVFIKLGAALILLIIVVVSIRFFGSKAPSSVPLVVPEATTPVAIVEQKPADLMVIHDTQVSVRPIVSEQKVDIAEDLDAIEIEDPVAIVPSVNVSLDSPVEEVMSDDLLTDTLNIILTDDCWLQVIDASGKKHIEKIVPSGESLQLFGLAPFDIMLGNANAVIIEFNGDPVPVVPRRGKRTLRLHVGE